jgi:hypothetical protein
MFVRCSATSRGAVTNLSRTTGEPRINVSARPGRVKHIDEFRMLTARRVGLRCTLERSQR